MNRRILLILLMLLTALPILSAAPTPTCPVCPPTLAPAMVAPAAPAAVKAAGQPVALLTRAGLVIRTAGSVYESYQWYVTPPAASDKLLRVLEDVAGKPVPAAVWLGGDDASVWVRFVAAATVNAKIVLADDVIQIGKADPAPIPPKPDPPGPIGRLWAAIVVESKAMTPDLAAAIYSPDVAAYLDGKGFPRLQVLDPDLLNCASCNLAETTKTVIKQAVASGLPRLVIHSEPGGWVYDGAPPKTAADLVKLLGEHGGEP